MISGFEVMFYSQFKFPFRFQHKLAISALLAVVICLAGCQNSKQLALDDTPASATPAATATLDSAALIVAFGDSLTAGFGLPEAQAFTTLLQSKINEKGYRYRVVNAGVSGDTSAGGVRRIDWALQGNVKFLILELGANDGLRGQPVAALKKNLSQIIERAQQSGVTVVLAGMEAPPNYGGDYTHEFRQVYQDLAQKYKLQLIPFFLADVGGVAALNQGDGIHPNAEGEKIMTENVWRVLEPMLAQAK